MNLCTICMLGVHKSQKGLLNFLEVELQTSMSCLEGVVLWKSSQDSEPPSHLSNPLLFLFLRQGLSLEP